MIYLINGVLFESYILCTIKEIPMSICIRRHQLINFYSANAKRRATTNSQALRQISRGCSTMNDVGGSEKEIN